MNWFKKIICRHKWNIFPDGLLIFRWCKKCGRKEGKFVYENKWKRTKQLE